MRNFVIIFFIVFTSNSYSTDINFITPDSPPFQYRDGNQMVGPFITIIQLVCKEMEITCKTHWIDNWRRAKLYVKNGETYYGERINAISTLAWEKERTNWLYYSPPIIESRYGFFTHKSNKKNHLDLKSLKGHTISVHGPSKSANNVKKIISEVGDMKINILTGHDRALKMLSKKRVKYIYVNKDIGHFITKKNKLKGIKYILDHLTVNYYIAFSKASTDKELVERFNKTYKKLYNKGLIKKAIIKDFSLAKF